MWLIRATAVIGSMTMISRLLGFARDMLAANILGAGLLSDAFFVAFRLPNLLRRLFAEGAFNSAFVPIFSGILATDGKDDAKRFAEEAMAGLLAILVLITLLAMVAMPWLIYIFAPGFSEIPEKYDLTVLLTRITFPYIILISLVSLLSGILNTLERFWAVAAAPIILNLCLIVALLLPADILPTPAHTMAWAVVAAGVLQLVWLIVFCARAGLLPKLSRPRLSEKVKRLLVVIAPATMGAGVAQINLLVDTILASMIAGAVSWLYYADRIVQLPLGVIGVAVSTALLPALARKFKSGKTDDAKYDLNRAIELGMLFALPSMAGLMCIGEPIIHTLFEHGQFSADDTQNVSYALIAFAAGLPSFILIKIFTSAFFAKENTRTPFLIASFCMILNAHISLCLIGDLGHVAMAIATSSSGWFNALGLLYLLKRNALFGADQNLKTRLRGIGLASAGMALAVLGAQWALAQVALPDALTLALLISAGALSFALLLFGCGVLKAQEIKNYMKRKA